MGTRADSLPNDLEGLLALAAQVIAERDAAIAERETAIKERDAERATIERSVVWANSRICQEASVRDSILGHHCHIGPNATLAGRSVLGDKSAVTGYSRL